MNTSFREYYRRLSHLDDKRLADYQAFEVESSEGYQHRYIPHGLTLEQLRGWLIAKVEELDAEHTAYMERLALREAETIARRAVEEEARKQADRKHDLAAQRSGVACSPLCPRCTDIDYERSSGK